MRAFLCFSLFLVLTSHLRLPRISLCHRPQAVKLLFSGCPIRIGTQAGYKFVR